MKIAVIGSGISGLTSSYMLAKKHEVHVFEVASRIGGHTHTVDAQVQSGTYAIDTGFIVFNDWTYPNFIRLLKQIGVEFKTTSMSFSVKAEKSGLEYNGTDLNRLFAQRRNLFNPSFIRMIQDILRFNKESVAILGNGDNTLTLGEYLKKNRYSRQFCDHYIVPMGAAIWSASTSQMQEFPVEYFVRFFKNHGMLSVNERPQWQVIQGGSRSYIPSLTKEFRENIHLSSPVLQVTRSNKGVRLAVGSADDQVSEADFDQVIFASHSDQTLRLLSDASAEEHRILSAFSYQANHTVLHTDESVLPKRKLAWAAWNYFVPREARSTVAVTYDMNILQGFSSPETFCVSLNLQDQIDPSKILRSFEYHHPVYTVDAVRAQSEWSKISGVNRTHFSGAYWGYGFHEDGVKSGLRVAKSLGAMEDEIL
jgi:predicted NAD/FAD-binding protein